MQLTALKLLGTSLRAGMLLAVAGAPLALALLLTRDTAGNWVSRSLLLVGTIGYSVIRRRTTRSRLTGGVRSTRSNTPRGGRLAR